MTGGILQALGAAAEVIGRVFDWQAREQSRRDDANRAQAKADALQRYQSSLNRIDAAGRLRFSDITSRTGPTGSRDREAR